MKKLLLTLLGTYSKKDFEGLHKTLVETIEQRDKFRREIFRKGDEIYVNETGYVPLKKYFLLESYNNKHHWHIGLTKESKHGAIGISVDKISFDEPNYCPCCNQTIIINKK